MYSVWHEMLKMTSVSVASLQTPAGVGVTTLPHTPSLEELLAFGNRIFASSALAISSTQTQHTPSFHTVAAPLKSILRPRDATEHDTYRISREKEIEANPLPWVLLSPRHLSIDSRTHATRVEQ